MITNLLHAEMITENDPPHASKRSVGTNRESVVMCSKDEVCTAGFRAGASAAARLGYRLLISLQRAYLGSMDGTWYLLTQLAPPCSCS